MMAVLHMDCTALLAPASSVKFSNTIVHVKRRGQYEADEAQRLAILKFAAILGADFVDVELKAAPFFFAGEQL